MPKVTRWHQERPPSEYEMRAQLVGDGLVPRKRHEPPSLEHPPVNCGESISIFILEGMLRITLPNEPLEDYFDLMAGDRIDIPTGTIFGMLSGPAGATIFEGKR